MAYSLKKSRDDRKNSQGYVNIKNLTTEQLDELILRQNKMLQNRSFLNKLPDNGKKILFFKTELEIVKKQKQEECDKACQLMLGLSLDDKCADELEWNQKELSSCKKELDTDDDDDNDDDDVLEEEEGKKRNNSFLKLLATHSGTAYGKNIKMNSLKSKIHDQGIKDIEKSLYIDKFCEKYGKLNNCEERFKPNQFKNNNQNLFATSAEQVKKKLGEKWEITQATPPIPIYKNVMMISLSESLTLQKEQAKKLKEIEQKHATEKLLQNMSLKMGNNLSISNTTEYRNIKNHFEANEDDENEFSDSDCEAKKNTVCLHLDDNR